MNDEDFSAPPEVRPAIRAAGALALLAAGATAFVLTQRKAALDAPINDTDSGVRVEAALQLKIHGHVAPLLVSRAIRAQFPALRACIPAPKDGAAALNGTVSLHIAALSTGQVLGVYDDRSTYPDPKAVECMVSAARAIKLPPLESYGMLIVDCPLSVQGGEILEPVVRRSPDSRPGEEQPAPIESTNWNE